jgi:hypothetical protein
MKCPFEVVEHWIIVGDEYSDDIKVCCLPDEEVTEDGWEFEYNDYETWFNSEMRNYPNGTIIQTSIHTGDYNKNDDGTFEWDPCGKHKSWESEMKVDGKWVIL